MSSLSPRDAALDILNTLRDAGHVAYFAGGCVRDRLLGLEPKDYDVATDATPEVVQKRFKRSNAVGAAFGVVLVYHGHGDQRITTEVATFRTDGDYTDGRRPDRVTFTDAKHDAQRRDFTINGLFEDPPNPTKPRTEEPRDEDPDQPTIIDYIGGVQDLNDKIIRAIGDPHQRFAEDYLRMLRAVRFAARFGFTIEPATADAIREHAPKLNRIARERIGDEFLRMFTERKPPSAATAAKLLIDFKLDDPVFDRALVATAQPDVLARLPDASDYPTRLVAWLPTLTQHELRQALSLSNEQTDAIRDLRATLRDLADLTESELACRKRVYARPSFNPAIQIARANHASSIDADERLSDRDALAHDGIGLAPDPILTGDDLIAAGFQPGPAFKKILDDVYDAQLEGNVRDRDAALALAKTIQP